MFTSTLQRYFLWFSDTSCSRHTRYNLDIFVFSDFLLFYFLTYVFLVHTILLYVHDIFSALGTSSYIETGTIKFALHGRHRHVAFMILTLLLPSLSYFHLTIIFSFSYFTHLLFFHIYIIISIGPGIPGMSPDSFSA